MRPFAGSDALTAALCIALATPLASQARDVTPENRAEWANVPRSWRDPRICFQEGGGVGGPRVVVGIDRQDSGRRSFSIRHEKPDTNLPGYVLNQARELTDRQISVTSSAGAGYTDQYLEVFVMPDGIRLTCEALPDPSQ